MKPLINDDPKPKINPDQVNPVLWPVERIIKLSSFTPPSPALFSEVIERRRSNRSLMNCSLKEALNCIAYTTAPRFLQFNDPLAKTRRLSPSAGALHPLEIIVLNLHGKHRLLRYNTFEHQVEFLKIKTPQELIDLSDKIKQILPKADGTAIIMLGDLERTAAIYENPDSLLWRDAGALLQTLFLTATSYNLAFCPLGILGHEAIRALGLEARLVPVGVALIGKDYSKQDSNAL